MSYVFLFLFSVFISSVSQIILKASASEQYDNIVKEYLNAKVICAYGIFFASSLLTVLAYRYIPLSLGPVLEASGYIFVSVLGYVFLKERISRRKMIGLLLIVLGIVVASVF